MSPTEFHLPCDPNEIARYVFCPGDQARARRIADHFQQSRLVLENRGYIMLSGLYGDVPMSVIGTGMGGPAVAIALEELGHMGADTFMRVGSCGVFQPSQQPGDVIIGSGTVRQGGTSMAYLPAIFPAIPAFPLLRALVEAAERLEIPVTVGPGVAGDAFYDPNAAGNRELYRKAGLVFIEMESDTLFILGSYHGWRTGLVLVSDGAPGEVKPEWGMERFRQGEENAIRVALEAMLSIASRDPGV